jgi:hypothetical protein
VVHVQTVVVDVGMMTGIEDSVTTHTSTSRKPIWGGCLEITPQATGLGDGDFETTSWLTNNAHVLVSPCPVLWDPFSYATSILS